MVLDAGKATIVHADTPMRTDSSLQKRNNCAKKSGWRRVASVLRVAVGMVRTVCAAFAADSVKQRTEIRVMIWIRTMLQRNQARIAQTNVRQEKLMVQCMSVWKMRCLLVCADHRIF